jgi:hypothetical protein
MSSVPVSRNRVLCYKTVKHACQAAGIGRRTAYDHRKRDDAFCTALCQPRRRADGPGEGMLTVGSVRPLRDARKATRARRNLRRKIAKGVAMCGAKRKYDGGACQARALPNGRCKFHGGMSTGAKTPEGRAKALGCLRQYRSEAPLPS